MVGSIDTLKSFWWKFKSTLAFALGFSIFSVKVLVKIQTHRALLIYITYIYEIQVHFLMVLQSYYFIIYKLQWEMTTHMYNM